MTLELQLDAARIGEMMLERVARWQREGCTAYCLPVVNGDLLAEAERVLRIRAEASNQYGGSQCAQSTTEKQPNEPSSPTESA